MFGTPSRIPTRRVHPTAHTQLTRQETAPGHTRHLTLLEVGCTADVSTGGAACVGPPHKTKYTTKTNKLDNKRYAAVVAPNGKGGEKRLATSALEPNDLKTDQHSPYSLLA